MVRPAFSELFTPRGCPDPFEPSFRRAPVKRDVDLAAQVKIAPGEGRRNPAWKPNPYAIVWRNLHPGTSCPFAAPEPGCSGRCCRRFSRRGHRGVPPEPRCRHGSAGLRRTPPLSGQTRRVEPAASLRQKGPADRISRADCIAGVFPSSNRPSFSPIRFEFCRGCHFRLFSSCLQSGIPCHHTMGVALDRADRHL